jgi:CRISPR-associated endonuclease/helicase Cas3
MAIWLLALAHHAERGSARTLPRRLVYVVNRRTVVDQATREAEGFLERLGEPALHGFWASLNKLRIQDTRELRHLSDPIAVSTLRGQLADNGSWRADPSRPSIIVGTVDMVGSRLLFSGYGRGFKTRPLHAGFLGQSSLLVHDEAHLEPAFQNLLAAVEREQGSESGRDGFGRLRVLALSATSRGEAPSDTFRLTPEDREHGIVRKRIFAKKSLALHPIEARGSSVAERVTELALAHRDSGKAVLVFLRRVEDVHRVVKKLPQSQLLTGTMRGYERERLRNDPSFARFDPKSPVPLQDRTTGTVYLVCTSAGEVGVDMSADHLVSDLTPYDSMAQRLGRVNRFGEGDALVDVVHESTGGEDDPYDIARQRTLELLRALPQVGERHDASPAALGELPSDERARAFSPEPETLPLTTILLDAWASTSIVEQLPGRPPVAPWLHGRAEWEPPETHVAWRREVDLLGSHPELSAARRVMDEYPLRPHELLQDTSKRVFTELERMAERLPDHMVWLLDPNGQVTPMSLGALTSRSPSAIEDITVVLSPQIGGLDERGLLSGACAAESRKPLDVADVWLDQTRPRRRLRTPLIDEDAPEGVSATKGMRLVFSWTVGAADEAEDEEAEETVHRWYVEPTSSDEQGSRTAERGQTLPFHLEQAGHFAKEIAERLELGAVEAAAVFCAARFHDLGKDRRLWQRSIGNFDPSRTLAKSGRASVRASATKYRHELGSLFDIEREQEFRRLSEETRDLVLHLIAAHHGRARPSFPESEVFDPNHTDAACVAIAREVPRRYVRLQRRYGRWGLAYLESLVRAADVLASLSLEDAGSSTPIEEAAE